MCPTHGPFLQTPASHLSGCGCPVCGREKTRAVTEDQRLTHEEFVRRANHTHNNKYQYPDTYVSYKMPLSILCTCHGSFRQTPDSHLSGSGCPTCGIEHLSNKFRLSREDFVRRSTNIHEDKRYSYDKFVYVNAKTAGVITCPTHGDFLQKPAEHLYKGAGCPSCKRRKLGGRYSESFFNRNSHRKEHPATLYVLRITSGNTAFIKVGITQQLLHKRLSAYPFDNIEVLASYNTTLFNAWITEQRMLAEFGDWAVTPPIHFAGSTECFEDTVDVYTKICDAASCLKLEG